MKGLVLPPNTRMADHAHSNGDGKVIISSDVRRSDRRPPGQYLTRGFPVLSYESSIPAFDPDTWSFDVAGLVESPRTFTWGEFSELPRVTVKADFHCVTTWSRLDNVWEGVHVHELMKHVALKPEAKFVLVHSVTGYTTNLPLQDFLGDDVLFALTHDGAPLAPEHGGPMRLIVPRLYAWKSAKWVSGVEFLAHDKPGFWEKNGYHNRGDPWGEERYNWD